MLYKWKGFQIHFCIEGKWKEKEMAKDAEIKKQSTNKAHTKCKGYQYTQTQNVKRTRKTKSIFLRSA